MSEGITSNLGTMSPPQPSAVDTMETHETCCRAHFQARISYSEPMVEIMSQQRMWAQVQALQ
jgi:hypothetical protein